MSEDQNITDGPVPGPNLAVLKGITWGLGVLLLAGVALVAVLVANRASREEATLVAVSGGLPPLPLIVGEQIQEVNTSGGLILITTERPLVPDSPGAIPATARRVLYLDRGKGAENWVVLPTAMGAAQP